MGIDVMDPSKLNVVELRAELQARGLDSKGYKSVLVKRLWAALEKEGHEEGDDMAFGEEEEEPGPEPSPKKPEPETSSKAPQPVPAVKEELEDSARLGYEDVPMEELGSQAPPDVAGASVEQGSDTTQQQGKGWPHEAVLLLIETYRSHQHSFSDNAKRKYQVWRDIAQEMQSRGYAVDGPACDQKMRALQRRYKIIKDNAILSGWGALNQWQYFSVLDDMLARDPAIIPLGVETCFPNASTSGMEAISPTAAAALPLMSFSPSPTPSLTSTPVPSPATSGDSMASPQPKRKKTGDDSVNDASQQILEKLITNQQERSHKMAGLLTLLNSRGLNLSERSVDPEKAELRKKIEDLQQRLLQQSEEHVRKVEALNAEVKAMLECRNEEIKEMQQQHKNEMKEMQQQHRNEIKEMQERLFDVLQKR